MNEDIDCRSMKILPFLFVNLFNFTLLMKKNNFFKFTSYAVMILSMIVGLSLEGNAQSRNLSTLKKAAHEQQQTSKKSYTKAASVTPKETSNKKGAKDKNEKAPVTPIFIDYTPAELIALKANDLTEYIKVLAEKRRLSPSGNGKRSN